MRIEFAKGHGAMNDFVLVSALDGCPELSPDEVRALCDRRAGIGADGVLRVTYGRYIDTWTGDPDVLFMDYRNADGSLAEMCGNGLRVFAKYVLDEGIAVGSSVQVGTRAGLRSVEALPDGRYKAAMGPARVSDAPTWTGLDERRFLAVAVDVGNPHAVAILKPNESIDALDLAEEPDYDQTLFPNGVNCEFVRATGVGQLQMRVFERGVGETMACGTGVVASVAAYARSLPPAAQLVRAQVSVPGGLLEVELGAEQAYLIGEAKIVAHGVFEVNN
ncbi:MAG: diaminopimelate epimerase [Propionibacteriaceae bacterium]|jgi:diaminopimelate epimerase|nr:diaminopimelate epimerase [Propionibacteriaceae bacterium]